LPAIPEETPASLMNRDPARYERVVDALEKDGFSPNAISALYGVHPNTVRKIRAALGPGACHSAIRHIASNMIESAQLLSARLVKEIDSIPPSQMASALAVLTDKILLLVGSPTQRIEIEHSKKIVSPEQLRAMFDKLPKQANAREVTPSHPRP
jgi:hypothetical protein